MKREHKKDLKALLARAQAIQSEAESIREELERIHQEMDDAVSEKTERWQDGPAGQKAAEEMEGVASWLSDVECAAGDLERMTEQAAEVLG